MDNSILTLCAGYDNHNAPNERNKVTYTQGAFPSQQLQQHYVIIHSSLLRFPVLPYPKRLI